ncbi:MAG: nitrilase-related carbon-nitrogen hydrolase [Gemmatimonadales bacterium]|nr:nitrilase-related carbon-nitrogen hydrolase [Gemmatimonadales bacterium]
MSVVRAAVVQDASVAFDPVATLDRVAARMAEAARARADLVVFPEAFIGCYPKGIDFGARVGMRSDPGREEFERYWRGAIEVPGPVTERLGELAGEFGTYLVIGTIERDGGTLYCTVLYFSSEGALLGRHRKVMPTAMERIIWGFGDGSTLQVLDTPLGKLGAVICWENYMPLLRTAMYAQGVELYCAPTVDDRELWTSSMRHIAREGRCFVLSACQFARRKDYPADYHPIQGDDPETVLIRGGSSIIDPMGTVLAGPSYGEAGVLVADLDLGLIPRGKYDFDPVGHYARPDLFSLRVNTAVQAPVRFDGTGGPP